MNLGIVASDHVFLTILPIAFLCKHSNLCSVTGSTINLEVNKLRNAKHSINLYLYLSHSIKFLKICWEFLQINYKKKNTPVEKWERTIGNFSEKGV